ncbi:hypothetical protein pb186bvf_019855 [Paramecium bursaria]
MGSSVIDQNSGGHIHWGATKTLFEGQDKQFNSVNPQSSKQNDILIQQMITYKY